MRRILLASSLLALAPFVACGSSSSGGSAAPPASAPTLDAGSSDAQPRDDGGTSDAAPDAQIPGKNGDLGGGSPTIDHAGPNGGLVGPFPSGPVAGSTWAAPGCGDVTLAPGTTDPQGPTEAFDAADPAPRDVHASFRFDTATSLSIDWATAPGTLATTVAYGSSPDKLDHFVQGVSFTYASNPQDPAATPLRVHEVHVCGLSPSQTIYFAVGGDGYFGKVYAARTAPKVDASGSFRFAVMGDSNNIVYDEFAMVAAAARSTAPDWVAFTGDLVHDGSYQSQWDQWFAAAGDLFASAPIMTAHGNHEMMGTPYFAQFALPGNEEYYAFDYGQVHFVVLNDSPPDDAEFDVEAKFLDDDLAAVAARATPPVFTVAMHHRPPYSSPGSNLTVRTKWTPIYDAHHVDLVLNGHMHAYESTKPLAAGNVVATPKDGTIYVVTGGAGSIINDPPDQMAFSKTYVLTYNYLTVDVEGRKLTLKAYGVDGAAIDDPIVISK